ncbi:MAG: alpha/beta hydrolase [Gammaproteobacteria bacterium]|nr:alpha/beta hydrolase [Gammaproteobacteria bacterium]
MPVMDLKPADCPTLDIESPKWFQHAVARPVTSHTAHYNGCALHYLRWPNTHDTGDAAPAAKPGLIFLHGGGAHANWWRFIAPFFADDFHVIAPDLSGMGDSGRRQAYDATTRAHEIDAVVSHAGLYTHANRPYVVGHSFGGFTGIRYCALYGERLAGFVMADTPIRPPAEAAAHLAARPEADAVARNYPDYDSALVRFRLRPRQTCANEFIVEFIARHSITRNADGWTWKFDPNSLGKNRHAEPFSEYLAAITCRTAIVYGEDSAVTTEAVVDYMRTLLASRSPVVPVPDAQHHLFLDQPLAFVAALRGVLANWRIALTC